MLNKLQHQIAKMKIAMDASQRQAVQPTTPPKTQDPGHIANMQKQIHPYQTGVPQRPQATPGQPQMTPMPNFQGATPAPNNMPMPSWMKPGAPTPLPNYQGAAPTKTPLPNGGVAPWSSAAPQSPGVPTWGSQNIPSPNWGGSSAGPENMPLTQAPGKPSNLPLQTPSWGGPPTHWGGPVAMPQPTPGGNQITPLPPSYGQGSPQMNQMQGQVQNSQEAQNMQDQMKNFNPHMQFIQQAIAQGHSADDVLAFLRKKLKLK